MRWISTLARRSFFVFVVALCLQPSRALSHEVVVHENIPYKTGPSLSEYERQRCALDLYLPEGVSGFPSLVWFYGGALTEGDKAGGQEVKIARSLAARGIAVVMVNYRLSGRVTFPLYVEDAAASVAWVLDHIERYRGARGRVFVSGHSAGGYLAAMVGLDPRYLAAHGRKPGDLAGLIPISGQTVTHATVRAERGLPPGQPVVDGAAPVGLELPILALIPGLGNVAWRPASDLR